MFAGPYAGFFCFGALSAAVLVSWYYDQSRLLGIAALAGVVATGVLVGVWAATGRAIAAEIKRAPSEAAMRAERGSGTYVEAQRLAYPLRSRTRFSRSCTVNPLMGVP